MNTCLHVGPVVVGARALHDVARGARSVAVCLLRVLALVVEVVGLLTGPLDGVTELVEHQALGGVPAGVEVHGAEDGLEGVGQDGGLLRGHPNPPRPCPSRRTAPTPSPAATWAKNPGVHHGGADLGQLPLGELGIARGGVAGHDQAEHGVARDNTVAGTTNVLTVGWSSGYYTFAGVIRNTGGVLGLTKTGVNTLASTGTNTFSPATRRSTRER